MMLPPWNKIEWGLPIAGRLIEFEADGKIYNGTIDELWRWHGDNGRMHITADTFGTVKKWRYVDVHTK